MTTILITIGICTCTSAFFKIIDCIERPPKKRFL